MKRIIIIMVLSFVLTMYGALARLENWPYATLFLILGISIWLIGLILVIKRLREINQVIKP